MKHFFNKQWYIAIIFFFCSTWLYAQSRTVSGTVISSEDDQVLPGVNILIKGTSVGTITDIEGNYSLNIPSDNAILVFSYIGFTTREVQVNDQGVIDVSMESEPSSLSEVVVIGYGEQSRETLTTAVSKVDNKVLENVPLANAANALQGTVSGVRVQTVSGQPGASPRVIVRGGTSINNPDGATPLYILDGVIREDIDGINPGNIESMQVLKDAAATSIYGARGSNGVVIITTKRGKAGATQTWLDASHGQGIGNDLTNNTAFTPQYLTAENEYKLNEGWQSMPDPR